MIPNTQLYVNLVREFHIAFDFKIYSHPEQAPIAIHKLRAKLIEEEFAEYCAAITKLEELDALCDLLYVLAGTAVTYSLAVFPYSAPAVTTFNPSHANIALFIRPILNDLHSLFPCIKLIRPAISDAMIELDKIGTNRGFKMREAFTAVHENNMDKLWAEKPDNKALTSVAVETSKGPRFLVKNLDGKVIKPLNHTKVDLTPYV